MNQHLSPKNQIRELFISLSEILGANISANRLKYYVQIFGDQPVQEMARVCNKAALNERFFPPPVWFTEELNGRRLCIEEQNDEAIFWANRIFQAVSLYGPHRLEEARKELGETVWGVIQDYGGWCRLCRIEESQVVSTRSNLKSMIFRKIREMGR